MNITKKERRQRRAVKTRAQIRALKVARLTVHRTPRHIYAQLFDGKGERVLGGMGTVIVSTPKGVMTDKAAHAIGQGGEVLCIVA